jgi:transcriptional regulator with XRE-family HTH domain
MPIQPELPISIGDRLRQARETAGLSTQEVADQTRIPRRHVEAIECNRLTALPSGPYAVGFARAMARIVGFPEEEAAGAMRAELARNDSGHARSAYEIYEPAESSRVPPKTLAWTAAIIGLLLVGGYTAWRTMGDAVPSEQTGTADAGTDDSIEEPAADAATAAPAAGALNGPLVIRATGDVWFGLNDPATGRLVFDRTLRAGESYAVPEEQRTLLLRTGRAQNLRLLVGNRELPQLGNPDVLVRDVGLTSAALATRAAGATAVPATPGSATPAP